MRHVLQQRAFFDDLATEWDILNDPDNVSRLTDIFRQRIPELPAPILDAGSGTGILLPILQQLYGHFVFEMDVAGKMLRVAREKFVHLNHHGFLQADAHHMPIGDERLGSVVCFSVYPHFHNPEDVATEIRRVLKKRGYIVILHLMNHEELNAMHAGKNEVVAGDRLPPAEKLAGRIASYGFHVVECEERSGFYLVVGQK